MRILAIETVDKTGSVAVLDGGRLLGELRLCDRRRSLQTLAPAVQQLLTQRGWRSQDVELVAAATGPGSFTGLRIGVATAKVFAYAAGSAVMGIGTMELLAAQVPLEHRKFDVVVDAQREELFVAQFERDATGQIVRHTEPRIEKALEWLQGLGSGDVVAGPALSKWSARLPAGVCAVDEPLWRLRAATVGQLAWEAFQAGRRQELFALVPNYYRQTAAEEQWQRQQTR